MTSNVGAVDLCWVCLVWVVLIVLGLTHVLTGTTAIVGYVVGAIALVTGLVRYCPAWSIFGINTCPLNPGNKK